MKKLLLTLWAIAICFVAQSQIQIIQVNAYWNASNTRQDLVRLKHCEYSFAYLEDQPESVKTKISSVPTLLIYNNGVFVRSYQAGINLELNTDFKEIQEYIYLLKTS